MSLNDWTISYGLLLSVKTGNSAKQRHILAFMELWLSTLYK